MENERNQPKLKSKRTKNKPNGSKRAAIQYQKHKVRYCTLGHIGKIEASDGAYLQYAVTQFSLVKSAGRCSAMWCGAARCGSIPKTRRGFRIAGTCRSSSPPTPALTRHGHHTTPRCRSYHVPPPPKQGARNERGSPSVKGHRLPLPPSSPIPPPRRPPPASPPPTHLLASPPTQRTAL